MLLRGRLKVLICLQALLPLCLSSQEVPVIEEDDCDDELRNKSKRDDKCMFKPADYAVVDVPPSLSKYFSFLNETHANISKELYVLIHRGPKYLPKKVVIPITTIYVLIFISGILGNSLVALVIVRNTNMHTATNFYLFSLAISDLLLLVLGLPNDLSVYWQQYPWIWGETICKLRAFCSEMCNYSSVLVIVAFSVERYLAVCRPLESYQISTFRRASKIILVIWVISFVCAIPFAVHTEVNYLDFPPGSHRLIQESAFCAMLNTTGSPRVPYYEISTIVFFFIPLVALIYIYNEILKKLKEREVSLTRQGIGRVQALRQQRSKRSIIRMLGSVVICFFLCWAPFHLQRLYYIYMTASPYYLIVNEWLYYITGCFYFSSSSVNPILYTLMSNKYRYAFKDILLCKFRNSRRASATVRNSNTRTDRSNADGVSTDPPNSTNSYHDAHNTNSYHDAHNTNSYHDNPNTNSYHDQPRVTAITIEESAMNVRNELKTKYPILNGHFQKNSLDQAIVASEEALRLMEGDCQQLKISLSEMKKAPKEVYI